MPRLRLAPSVSLDGLQEPGVKILSAFEQATRLLGRDLRVTCGTDSHDIEDPHSNGAAIDVGARDLPDGIVIALRDYLMKALGADFTVLYETKTKPAGVLAGIAYVNPNATGAHIHVQLRKGLDVATWSAA